MTDKIVGLDGKPIGDSPAERNQELIELLERCINDVKQNGAHSILIATIIPTTNDFDVECYWHGRKLSLLSACGRMAHRINLQCDATSIIIC